MDVDREINFINSLLAEALKLGLQLVKIRKNMNDNIKIKIRDINELLFNKNNENILKRILDSTIVYEINMEKRRTLMHEFSNKFNMALRAISNIIIQAITSKDDKTYFKARSLILKAADIINSLEGTKITGLRADILCDLKLILLDSANSLKYTSLRIYIDKIINAI